MYTDSHRTLLQMLIHEGAVLDVKFKEYSCKLFPHTDINMVVYMINEQLNTVNMMLKSTTCDNTGERYWTVVSLTAATVDKNYLPFKSNNLTFLRSVFCEIITSGVGCVSSVDSLNLIMKLNCRLYKLDAEEFIEQLCGKKWLYKREGYIFIGPRSAAELTNYFKENFPDMVTDCVLCKQVVFYGKICPGCGKKVHFKCLQSYTAARNQMICPKCNHKFDSIDDNLQEIIEENAHLHSVLVNGLNTQSRDDTQTQTETQTDEDNEEELSHKNHEEVENNTGFKSTD